MNIQKKKNIYKNIDSQKLVDFYVYLKNNIELTTFIQIIKSNIMR